MSPQQIEYSSTLSQIGQVRYLSCARNCQTHGDVDCFAAPMGLVGQIPKQAVERTELSISQQPRAPQTKLKYVG